VTIQVHLTPIALSTAPGTPDLIKNKATATANEPDPNPANNTAQVSVTVKP
jgi:hypothetical protein